MYRDPYAGKYFKIFLAAFIFWLLLSGIDFVHVYQSSLTADGLVKYKVTFFGLPLYSFGVKPEHDSYLWHRLISIPKIILSAIAIITLVFAVIIYVTPEIKKLWSLS